MSPNPLLKHTGLMIKDYSSRFNLNYGDLIRGLILAVSGAVFALIMPILQAWLTEPGWTIPNINWAMVVKTSIATSVVYLGNKFLAKEPKQIIVDRDKTQVIEKYIRDAE